MILFQIMIFKITKIVKIFLKKILQNKNKYIIIEINRSRQK